MTLNNNANEINITRVYDAPVKAVWDAWTDPEQVAQWWGPRGFTLTHHSKDLRPGGHWHYTMHGPDGTDYPNKTKYFEVEEYAKLVYDHGANDEQAPLFRVTVLFTEIDGKTKMDMTMTLPSPEAAKATKQFIKEAGGNATWDRLAEYLEKCTSSDEIFVINRTFEASIETVFEMWIKPVHATAWFGPKGATMEYTQLDIQEGGTCFYKMVSEEMPTMYGKINYLKICPPNLIVYTQQFCDAEGNIARHPLAPTWPETMLTTVQFTAESPEETRITLSWAPYGEATPDEIDTFVSAKTGMTQGWTGSFDRLDDYIEQIQVKA